MYEAAAKYTNPNRIARAVTARLNENDRLQKNSTKFGVVGSDIQIKAKDMTKIEQ